MKRVQIPKFIRLVVLISALIFVTDAFAQSTKTKARRTKRTSRTTPYYQLGTGMMMWQEKIEGEKGGAKANFMTQSIGAKLSYTYNQFYGERSRWRKIYSGEAMVGTIKGKAHGIFTDELNKQPWLAVQGVAGWVYRTAPVSEVGLFVPAIVRFIGWDLAAGSSLKMDKQFSFSAGYGGIYTNRFNKNQALNLTVTHQYLWKSTTWAISWEQTL